MSRLSCSTVRSFLVFTSIIFITSLEGKPRPEASRDCANPEPNFKQSVEMGVGSRSGSEPITKGEKNVSITTNSNVVMATIFEEFESRLSRLERRLRAIEQPGKRGLSFFFFLSPLIDQLSFLYVESAMGMSCEWFTVWQMSSGEEDWEICAEGPCRCQPEIKLVSCWRQDLLDLPATQLVPRDVLKL